MTQEGLIETLEKEIRISKIQVSVNPNDKYEKGYLDALKLALRMVREVESRDAESHQ